MAAGSSVEYKAILECMGPITLGPRARISQYVHLVSGTHDYHRRDMQIICKPIVLGADVWIAADAFVGAGVTIGERTIVGAVSGRPNPATYGRLESQPL
jgi:putative colanic acid biosynthesis acetyltransferase WcaF